MNKIHKKEPTAKGKNPYATNRGGFISAPPIPPRATPPHTA